MVTSDCYRSFAVPVVDTSGFWWLVVTTGGLSTHNYFGCGNPACTTQRNTLAAKGKIADRLTRPHVLLLFHMPE